MSAWVYILHCVDDTYYTGSTNNLVMRLVEHHEGMGSNYTEKRRPVRLVYCKEFPRIEDAYDREKQIQGWSRKKKEALIIDNKEKLPELSKNYTEYPR